MHYVPRIYFKLIYYLTYYEPKIKKPVKDKRAKFIELGEKRMGSAIRTIGLIGNLSDKNNYIYTDADALLIIKVLRTEVAKVADRFKNSESIDQESIFKFKDNA